MAEETRRSARATKGQNSKLDLAEQISEPKKKIKKGKKAAAVLEEPSEIIRCICGAIETGNDDKDPWIACDGCDAWQHNICMGISSYGEDVPEQYFCEQCHPQDHKELLASLKRNEKLWEERRRIYEEEQAIDQAEESNTKKKGKKKGKKIIDPSLENIVNTKVAALTLVTGEKKPIQKITVTKRKFKDDPQENRSPKETPSKVRKLSAAQTPRQSSPQNGLPVRIIDIDSTRQGAAKVLLKSLLHTIPQAIRTGIYTLSSNDTLEAKAERLAITVENAVHLTHPDKAAYAKQSRAIASNLKHNLELSEGLLSGTLLPQTLAVMSTDDMASQELKKEKEKMKARADKQSIMVVDDGPRVRRTHKGEELIEGDVFTVPDDSTISVSRRRSMHDSNNALKSDENTPASNDLPMDINDDQSHDPTSSQTNTEKPLKIQTLGSPSAKKTSGPQDFDINKVFKSVQSPVLPKLRRTSGNDNPPPAKSPIDDPEIDKLLQDDGIESPPYSPAEHNSDPSIIWRGTVNMDSVANFPATAKHVGGVNITQSMPSIQWSDVLAKDLKIAGRIDQEKANEYLCSLRYSPPTDLVVVNVSPTGDEYDEAFMSLYRYFQSRARYGVLTNKGIGNIRDTYLVPVPPSPDKLDDFITNLEGHLIPEERSEPMIIIALVIRNEWQPGPENQSVQRGSVGSNDHTSSLVADEKPALIAGTGPQISPTEKNMTLAALNPLAVQLQHEIDQRRGEEAARRILGDNVKAPTVAFLMPQAYQMREVEWSVISEILREDEKARDDLQHLSIVLERRMAGKG
ncbi:hypothetical protein K3495_g4509 [Podosphaera aphanis]|nr:hypothetical protein K3495_g4509 [Podosphaera aphanis]